MNRYIVSEPSGQLLLSVRPVSRLPDLIGSAVIAVILLVVLVYAGVFVWDYVPQDWPPLLLIALALAVYMAIAIRDYFRNKALLQTGEVYRFDRSHNAVTHNGVAVTALSEIMGVQVHHNTGGRSDYYSLELLLHGGGKANIPAMNKAEIEELASRIAAYLGLTVSYYDARQS